MINEDGSVKKISELRKYFSSINKDENYGYIPTKKNCIVDFDHPKYNDELEKTAKEYMVIKTAHDGRHLPIKHGNELCNHKFFAAFHPKFKGGNGSFFSPITQ